MTSSPLSSTKEYPMYVVPRAYACNLSIGHLGGDRVLAVLVDHVLPVGLDVSANHLLPVLVVVSLGKGRTSKGECHDGDDGRQKALCPNHGSLLLSICVNKVCRIAESADTAHCARTSDEFPPISPQTPLLS